MSERGRTCGRYAWLLILGLLLGACGGSSDADPTETSIPTTPSVETPVTSPEPTPTPTPEPVEPEPLPDPVQVAIEAAAEESGVDPADVRVISYAQREWPSTALGCPRPGFFYAQVVTPGYEIHLEAAGTAYRYHSDRFTNVVLCEGV